MTEDMMSLRTFVETTPDADLLREMIGFAAERLMELEVGAATGAGYGEKNPLRQAQRNGYRDRDWQTRAGTLNVPALPAGSRVERNALTPPAGTRSRLHHPDRVKTLGSGGFRPTHGDVRGRHETHPWH